MDGKGNLNYQVEKGPLCTPSAKLATRADTGRIEIVVGAGGKPPRRSGLRALRYDTKPTTAAAPGVRRRRSQVLKRFGGRGSVEASRSVDTREGSELIQCPAPVEDDMASRVEGLASASALANGAAVRG